MIPYSLCANTASLTEHMDCVLVENSRFRVLGSNSQIPIVDFPNNNIKVYETSNGACNLKGQICQMLQDKQSKTIIVEIEFYYHF